MPSNTVKAEALLQDYARSTGQTLEEARLALNAAASFEEIKAESTRIEKTVRQIQPDLKINY